MKKLFMIAAAASLVATMANAQTTVETTTGAAGATIRIELKGNELIVAHDDPPPPGVA